MTRSNRTLVAALTLLAVTTSEAPLAATPTTSPATRPATSAAAPRLLEQADVDPFIGPLVRGEWLVGAAVGVVTPQGSRVFGYGKFSDADPRVPGGDTVFEIASVTKVFTALLLAQAARDGQASLDDPVASLLPASARVPQRNGKQITLRQLSAHTSGLPRMPGNFAPEDPANPFADYTVEQMYAFLADATLPRDPGERYEYSNLGAGLLGHALSLKAGKTYEALILGQIARPLGMPDTRLALDDALLRRLAPGHDADGKPARNWDMPTLAGGGGLRSTVDDMLRFVAAQARIAQADPAMAKAIAMTHAAQAPVGAEGSGMEIALGWHIDTKHAITWHNGQTGGYHGFVGFNAARGVGVVILSNSADGHIDAAGTGLLRRMMGEDVKPPVPPAPPAVAPEALEGCVGSYLLGPGAILTIMGEGSRLFAQLTG